MQPMVVQSLIGFLLSKGTPMRWKNTIGKRRLYSPGWAEEGGRRDVILWEVIDVQDGEVVTLIFESKKSPYRQGVWLYTDRGIVIEGELCPSLELWSDTAPRRVPLECHTSTGKLSFYNIWDPGSCPSSQCHSSGMLVTELPNGRRYRCNDIGFDGKFDQLVFRIERSRSRSGGSGATQRARRPSPANRTKPSERGGKAKKGAGRTSG